jgi:outer membrane biosynthesis protein TonB|tara:strand:+ start:76 stop:534 length:459 start_codon:yes stop_codon:yes gene_type:complete
VVDDILTQIDGEMHLGEAENWDQPEEAIEDVAAAEVDQLLEDSKVEVPEPEPIVVPEPEPIVVPEPTPEPVVEVPEPVVVPELVEEESLADLFAGVSDTPATSEPPTSITTNEVASFLDQLPSAGPVGKASASGPAPVVVTDDIDSLINLFT